MLGIALLGGGARAAYQVGVLARLAEKVPGLSFPLITGVSAGAANAMALAGRESLEDAVTRLRESWRKLDPGDIFDSLPSGRAYSLFGLLGEFLRRARESTGAFQGLFNDHPIRKFVSGCMHLPGMEANLASGKLHAVGLSASSYDTGKTVTFFQGSASHHPWSRDHGIGVSATLTLDHVMASGAIPLLFPPIRIEGGLYGDGNVRQQFPLSPLVRLGADRILIVDPGPSRQSVETRGVARGGLAETLGLILDSMVVDRIESDVARLEEINDALAGRVPWPSLPLRRPIEHLMIRPTTDVGAIAASLGPPRCTTLRLIARAAGGWDERTAGLLSYLWVDRRFTDRLFDLGYRDAGEREAEIERFVSRTQLEDPSQSQVA